MATEERRTVPFNEIEGTASSNVPAYSNKNSRVFSIYRHYVYGIYTGFEWQCVEYARRWLLLRKSCIFRDISDANSMWNGITFVERVTDARQFPLRPIANGSQELPKQGSLLIYHRSVRMPFGHVAIITDVIDNHVHIAEQNNLFHYWPGDFARRAPIRCENGLYYIDDEHKLYGWMEIQDDGELKPFDQSDKDKILPQYTKERSLGIFERLFTSRRHDTN